MLRVKLLRLSDEDHAVLLTMHHIVSDGWSMGVLIKRSGDIYAGLQPEALNHRLPELAIQYADFAVWQRSWLQGEELERLLAYWRKQLGGTLPVLQLPTDHDATINPSYNGAQRDFPFVTWKSALR